MLDSGSATGQFVQLPPDLNSLLSRGIRAMWPGIPPSMSLLNSIYELKDFRRLPKRVTKLKETLVKLKKSFKSKGSLPLKELAHQLTSGHLEYVFNLKPIISDVVAIMAAMRTVDKKLKGLINNQRKWRIRHFRVPITTDSPDFETKLYRDFPNHWGMPSYDGVIEVSRSVSDCNAWFHCMMEYNYYYPSYQAESARLRAYLDYFGVNLNPAIIWNAIPYSFVVDWVLGVSSWLNQFAHANLEPVIDIRRCLYSVKRTRKVTVLVKPGQGLYEGAVLPTRRLIAAQVKEKSYIRNPFTPTISSLQVSGLNSNELSLIGSLITNKLTG